MQAGGAGAGAGAVAGVGVVAAVRNADQMVVEAGAEG